MIQDIQPHIYKNEYKPSEPQKGSVVLFFHGRKVLTKEQEEIGYLSYDEAEQLAVVEETLRYLFSIDGRSYYLGEGKKIERLLEQGEMEGYHWREIHSFRNALPKEQAFAGVTGWQLYNWYESRKFCGRCGTRMEHAEKERMMHCPECGQMEFPKICPAVIVGVTHGNKILLSKYADREYKKYALLAGFTEIGETPEETVKREVMEEVGLRVKNIRYYKSQPWSFSDTLLMGFFCELDGEPEITLDEDELALAEWVEREAIPVKPEDCSLTNEMIIAFKENKKTS